VGERHLAAGSEVGPFLASLTPVTLRTDTAVTNNGFKNGVATPFQSVLQAGTAVLVDPQGLPRVRCFCGNPLGEPDRQTSVRYTGTAWDGFSGESVTVVAKAPVEVREFVVVKPDTNEVVSRPQGTSGEKDQAADPAVAEKVRKSTRREDKGVSPNDSGPNGGVVQYKRGGIQQGQLREGPQDEDAADEEVEKGAVQKDEGEKGEKGEVEQEKVKKGTVDDGPVGGGTGGKELHKTDNQSDGSKGTDGGTDVTPGTGQDNDPGRKSSTGSDAVTGSRPEVDTNAKVQTEPDAGAEPDGASQPADNG